ncbi:SDR family oxidoreductase [Streptomyces sp. URMC 126]|uniref:SDR family oxidoreductase n=1 Tax=Streptomyces sp. URMC 126 TaxID=3423401 RepID=UPI003F1C0D7E
MSILFTGATGFLGCRLVRELLADDGDTPITVVGRGSAHELRARLLAAVNWLDDPPLPAGALDRLRCLSGDVTLPRLGLTAEEQARVTDGLTRVWHNAALIAQEGEPAAFHLTNVIGTRHVLELLDRAPGAHLAHVGTAYVAGRRPVGRVLEDDLREDHGFHTAYEESKYTAERLVRAWAARTGRPVTVLRPGLLVTDRPAPQGLPVQPLTMLLRVLDSGLGNRAARDNGPDRLLNGPGSSGGKVRIRIAVGPHGTLNIVQADYAARAMARTVAAHAAREAALRTVHVTHPRNTPTEAVVDAIQARHPGFAFRPVPHLPDPTPLEKRIAGQAAFLLALGSLRRTYDRTNLLAAVGDLPDPQDIDRAYLVRAGGLGPADHDPISAR